MVPRIFVINILLAVLVTFLGVKTYGVWFPEPGKDTTDPAVQEQAPLPRMGKPMRNTPESTFLAVVNKNLFSPIRKERPPEPPKPKKVEPKKTEAKKPAPKKVEAKIVELKTTGTTIELHGIVIVDDYQKALISDPKAKTSGEANRWVTLGDSIGGFKVSAIEKDRLILREGPRKYEVLLYDDDNPGDIKAVASGSKLSAGSSKAKETRVQPKTNEKKAAAGEKRSPQVKKADEPGYEMVRTPFGYIKRKVKE